MIADIDHSINETFKGFCDYLDQVELTTICEFKICDGISQNHWDSMSKKQGIYFIEIKNNNQSETIEEWKKTFVDNWNELKGRWTPNSIKKRLLLHNELKDWIPLYIGKSKDIKVRIKEHLYQRIDRKTFSLKMVHRKNISDETFRLKVLMFPDGTKNYSSLAPYAESYLRNKLNPIVGR